MATKLVIVESPTKAHKIGDYLGKGYTVMASVGHIRDLAQPSQVPAADKAKFGKFGVDVNDGFKPYYIVDGDKKRTVSELKSAAASSTVCTAMSCRRCCGARWAQACPPAACSPWPPA